MIAHPAARRAVATLPRRAMQVRTKFSLGRRDAWRSYPLIANCGAIFPGILTNDSPFPGFLIGFGLFVAMQPVCMAYDAFFGEDHHGHTHHEEAPPYEKAEIGEKPTYTGSSHE